MCCHRLSYSEIVEVSNRCCLFVLGMQLSVVCHYITAIIWWQLDGALWRENFNVSSYFSVSFYSQFFFFSLSFAKRFCNFVILFLCFGSSFMFCATRIFRDLFLCVENGRFFSLILAPHQTKRQPNTYVIWFLWCAFSAHQHLIRFTNPPGWLCIHT